MSLIISVKAVCDGKERQINFEFNKPFSKSDIHEKTTMLTESAIRTLETEESITFID